MMTLIETSDSSRGFEMPRSTEGRKAPNSSRSILTNPSFLITNISNLSLYTSLYTNRELKRERAWSRINLIPLLMAESDRDVYRRDQANLKREKEIMKDVDGWEVSLSCPTNLELWSLYLFFFGQL